MRKVYIFIHFDTVLAFSNALQAYNHLNTLDIKKISYGYFISVLNKKSEYYTSQGTFYKRFLNS